MKTNLLTLVVTLTVGIILAGSLLMPVISEATTTERTLTNEGVYYIQSDNETHTLEFDHGVYTIDGEVVSIPITEQYTFLATDSAIFRSYGQSIQIRGSVSITADSCSLTIANGEINGTYTSGDTTDALALEYTSYVLATNSTEDRVMKSYTSNAYLKGDSVVSGRGVTGLWIDENHTTRYMYILIDGTIDDGLTATVYGRTDFTVSDLEFNVTPTEGYEDCYTFGSITFNVTHTSGTVTPVTYTAIIVPTSVTAELSQHLSSAEIAIMNAIPVMIIVALVLMAVGALYLKRDD